MLAKSPAAEVAFAPIWQGWHDRKVDIAVLRDFLRQFPADGAAPLAKVYLAFALIDQGQLAQAGGVLATLASLPSGATRDLATVAKARSLRLHHAPKSALFILRPLVGKIVDDADREIFLEEIALSAIASRDDDNALAYLDAWLRGVGEDNRDRVRAKITEILGTLPRAVLENTYRTMRASGGATSFSGETQKLVAARLARIAVDTNDAALARWLYDVSAASATEIGGDTGLELSELASSRRGLSIVLGRTVGLLLPTRSRALRDEAADVVRGVSWALDLPRGVGGGVGVRLVTRNDGGSDASARAAMEELAGEGASVILGGFDRKSADRASRWSEQSGVAVLLLASPSPNHMPKTTAFVIGERVERELEMLTHALVDHGTAKAAFVADTREDEMAGKAVEAAGSGLALLAPIRCDVALAEAKKTRFPVTDWLVSGAEGWLVSGPNGCASDLLRDVRRVLADSPRASAERPVALTLEAGVSPRDVPNGIVVLSASAGLVPVAASRPEETGDDDMRVFMERFGVRPTYWTAIGRDAGVLVRAALSSLPENAVTDPKGIEERRAIVQAGLKAARLRLWTTDEMSIGDDRVLARALRVVTWKSVPNKK
ncbi:MAG: hypothetical protein FWD73_07985 [Polyangiaceae bacterium]|nr:hypothetical protein [Polyangiaceae bacterium]